MSPALLLAAATYSGPGNLTVGAGLTSWTLDVGAFALVWIVGGSSTTTYGMTHLEAGRSAVILLAELVSAVASASLVKGRIPSVPELVGGGLILGAAALDILESTHPPREPA